ncbi:helix-turn-helix domain-containing protein [Hoeflea alexandrii]|jgi:transcriptional regulator with XRE-family HTH domain|uniref:Helix-turn-helix domain-containing protein n=1 Tax=Hoeflea alexandrii TaxID=288436 RepID=A0ABT1CY96_9HYPH|nr:helix-turn-helix transcriptional regulator [Hoeflea alexandrii]MCO6410301.1 helix-turn-helix domain-containing protein [Hoeflea alexandrii]
MHDMTADTYDDGDTLGGRITRARDLASLTLEEAASRIGVTDETLSEWESDRSEPRANKIMTLAGVLGVSPAWLISGAGEAPQSPGISVAVDEMSGEINRLRELAAQISTCIETLESRLVTLTRAAND